MTADTINPTPLPTPVLHGNVLASFHDEVRQLFRELEQRRTFDEDITAWFAKHPDLSARFETFQRARDAQRESTRRAAAKVNAKRRARR